jgi:hypothetical protein
LFDASGRGRGGGRAPLDAPKIAEQYRLGPGEFVRDHQLVAAGTPFAEMPALVVAVAWRLQVSFDSSASISSLELNEPEQVLLNGIPDLRTFYVLLIFVPCLVD